MLLSIVVVTFNNNEALIRTLNSIKCCSDSKFNQEIIIVDGGDDSFIQGKDQLLQSLNLAIIKEPDDGIFDAMNKGFEMSSGEWVTFMNSGDLYNPNFKLEDALVILRQTNKIWAVGNAQIYVKGRLKDWQPSQINKFKFRLGLNSFPHQSTFYRREEIKALSGDPFRTSDTVADWSLSFKLLLEHQPESLEFYVSINEEAGKSQNIPLLTWSRDVTKTRQRLGKLFTNWFFADFLLQIAVGVLSRTKNRIK